MTTAKASGLDWLINDLVSRLAGAEHAVVLSADGLLICRSRELSREDGEHLSAMASAFQSLARGVGTHFEKGDLRQTVVELDRAYLVVTAAGEGACLALLASETADMGMVAYQMAVVVRQVGDYLVANPRNGQHIPRADPYA
jgi:predicted regulator of Ras-like GTPase activity (Roadblock/LC7/MglB family)